MSLKRLGIRLGLFLVGFCIKIVLPLVAILIVAAYLIAQCMLVLMWLNFM
jgi:hypothetical protein